MKYYEILDLSPDATPEQIKDAYRILVQLHHPDRLQQAAPKVREYAEERLKKINEAYTVLSDPDKRARYDAAHRKAARRAEATAYYDDVVEEDWVTSTYPRQASRRARHTTPEQEAYRAWMREQKEREAEARAAEYAQRRAQEAERERREAEERAHRAAAEAFPRARAQNGEIVLTFAPGVWTTLVRVPAGEFVMGSDPARDPLALKHELPRHRVYVSEFYLGKYPVTNAQYQAFLTAARYQSSAGGQWRMPPGKENHPAVNVTWDDAVAFCKWLSGVTGHTFRLPTEAEWEKAARGPATGSGDDRLYPWGDEWDATKLNGDSGQGDTTPVGQYSPGGDSPYGLADMSGNVWEWCHDWFWHKEYERRSRAVARDPQGPASGEGCVVRGGAFDSSPRQTRCAHRNWHYPYTARKDVGFRIVAEAR